MTAPRYRCALTRELSIRIVDDLFIAYHRRWGSTHVLTSDVMAVLQCVTEDGISVEGVVAQLSSLYELSTEDELPADEVVALRLQELSTLGLIEPVA